MQWSFPRFRGRTIPELVFIRHALLLIQPHGSLEIIASVLRLGNSSGVLWGTLAVDWSSGKEPSMFHLSLYHRDTSGDVPPIAKFGQLVPSQPGKPTALDASLG
jgi:hypothetical protein